MKHGRGMKFGAAGVTAIAMGMIGQPAFAAEIKPSIETTVRLGYDTNPFLTQGNDLASGSVKVGVRPSLSYRTETGETVLSGTYDRSEYLRRYGHTDEYGATLDTRQRFSSAFDAFVTLRYDSSVIGESDDYVSGLAGPPPIDDTDINLIGQRQRSNIYSAQAGFNLKVSPRDTISVDGGFALVRYPDRPAGSSSDNYNGRVGYTHAISEKTRVGASIMVYRIEYDVDGLRTMVVQPGVTFSTKLSPTWTFDATAGISFSKNSVPGFADTNDTGWAGSANLCHKGSTNRFCFYGSRSVSSSGIGGTTERTQGGASFEQQITSRLGAHASASYSRSTSQIGNFGTREYISAQAGLDWRATPWLRLGADARYRDVFGRGLVVDSDIGGEVSATVVLPGPK
ncbi:MAG: hypothetical protein JWR77_2132 [Rhizorhabdus sp.]|nr:hypothetical protein [Rhizorhabdus sp.]